MDLSLQTLLDVTKLTIRSPAEAARAVKAAQWPMQASILVMVLSGVASGLIIGLLQLIVPPEPIQMELADGSTIMMQQSGPIMQSITGVVVAFALAFAMFHIGRRMGGAGRYDEIMALTAALQMVMVVLVMGQVVVALVSPLLALMVVVFAIFVFFRALANFVNVGHEFNDMGRSIFVVVFAFVGLLVGFMLIMTLFGTQITGAARVL